MTSQTSDACPMCGRPRERYMIPGLFGGCRHWQVMPCECEAEAERLERRDRRAEQLRKAWEKTGVPKRYLDVTPDFESLGMLEGGRGIYMHGNRGNGKTHHACEVLKAYVSRNTGRSGWCNARFVSAPRWLDAIRDTYGSRWSSSEDAFQTAAGVDLLVLDDFGKVDSGVPTWAVSKLFNLVSERYNDMRPTVFTSRYSLRELVNRLADGDDCSAGDMASRIAETCSMLRFDGEDRRLAR